jgi:exopolysaccharide production protein ExoQ
MTLLDLPGVQRTTRSWSDEPQWGEIGGVAFLFLLSVTSWVQIGLPNIVQVAALPALGVMALLMSAPGAVARAPISMLCLGYLLWMGMSLAWSNDPSTTMYELRRWAVLPLTMFIASSLPSRLAAAALGAVVAVLVSVTALWYLVAPSSASRAAIGDSAIGLRGPFAHKSTLGLFLAVALAFLLASRLRSSYKAAAAVGLTLLLLLSQSATGISAALVAAAVWLLVSTLASAEDSRARTLGGVTAVGMLIMGVYIAFASLPVVTASFGKDITLTGRTYIWAASVRVIAERPWLGYGWGGVWADPFRDPTATMNRQIGFQASHAHNSALQLLLELGIVGLVLWLGTLVLLIRLGWQLLRRDDSLGMLLVLVGTVIAFAGLSEVTSKGPLLVLELALIGIGLSRRRWHRSAERSAMVDAGAHEADGRARTAGRPGKAPEQPSPA